MSNTSLKELSNEGRALFRAATCSEVKITNYYKLVLFNKAKEYRWAVLSFLTLADVGIWSSTCHIAYVEIKWLAPIQALRCYVV